MECEHESVLTSEVSGNMVSTSLEEFQFHIAHILQIKCKPSTNVIELTNAAFVGHYCRPCKTQ
jgi:hypothetical protein